MLGGIIPKLIMKIGIFIITLTLLILLGIVLGDYLNRIDIVATKNNSLQREKLMNIKEIKNIDSLYLEFEKQTQLYIKERARRSNNAIVHSWQVGLAMLLVILNSILIIRYRNKNAT